MSEIPNPPPLRTIPISHGHTLERLRLLGWTPRTVYDIGAFQGLWSKRVHQIFPDSEVIQFEANPANQPALMRKGLRHFIVALGARDNEERVFFTPKTVVATGASLYRENTSFYEDQNLITYKVLTRRLDSLSAEQQLPPAQLIKIDVQGAELDVIAGAAETMKGCDALILETSLLNYNKGAPLFGEVVSAVTKLGFACVDLCEVHQLLGVVIQLDLLFVRKPLYQRFYAASGLL